MNSEGSTTVHWATARRVGTGPAGSGRAPQLLRGRRGVAAGILGGLAAFVAFGVWSLAVPVGGGPDEPGHVVKAAAAVRGDLIGVPSDSPGRSTFILPANVAAIESAPCFAFDPTTSAACMPSLENLGDAPVTAVSGVGSYNPIFYLLVGWPSLVVTGTPMVLAMRLVAAALGAFFVGVSFWAATFLPRNVGVVVAGLAVALTPTTYFLCGVVNPNGLEVPVVLAFTVLALAAGLDPTILRRRRVLVLLAVLTMLAVNLRVSTPLFLLVGIVAAVVLAGPRRLFAELRSRAVLVLAVPTALVVGFGAVWAMRISGPAGYIPVGTERPAFLSAVVGGLRLAAEHIVGAIALFGWADTRAPLAVYLVWFAAFALPMAAAMLIARGRRCVLVGLAVAVALVGPAVLAAPLAASYGYVWQGRYGIALYGAVVLVAASVIAADRPAMAPKTARRLVGGSFATTSVVVAYSLALALKRFTVGMGGTRAQMSSASAWRPPLAWSALLVIEVVALVLLSMGAWVAATASRGAEHDSAGDAQPVRHRRT